MKTLQKVTFVILLIFFICSSFSLGLTATPQIYEKASDSEFSMAPEISTPSPEPPHRLVPISMLVYTEYVDSSSGGEYENTMTAINNTYGTDYYTTNLTDYNYLSGQIGEYDIFLIPEQELVTDDATMRTIGQAWSGILPDYVNDGGIVILMSYWSMGGAGTTSYIYNETGLMEIYGFTDVSYTTINLVNTSDALARGISSSWSCPDGTISFDSPDQTTVVEDGSDPVVIHKTMGTGHAILLGFDLYELEGNCSTILGNAIRLHRHVIFDESHTPSNFITGAFSDWVDDLVADGFAVSSMGSFSPNFFAAGDVLVISTSSVAYTPGEVTAIAEFVAQGGGLFFIADYAGNLVEIEPIAHEFGFDLEDTLYIIDTDDFESSNWAVLYDTSNVANHSITLNAPQIQYFASTGILSQPAHAHTIIATDTDGTAEWNDATPADGIPVCSSLIHEQGRVVVTTDFNWLKDNQNADSDGTNDYYDSSNEIVAVNTIRWLSAARLVERKVLFDVSHSPYIGFASFFGFANYLTSNGYTVHWMSTFYTSLIETTNVLVLLGSATPYTPAENVTIRNFVDNGGGVLLVVDWTFFGDSLLPIAQEFGMSHNSTHAYLSDSDDGTGSGNSGITYDGVNIGIGTHPITDEVNRLYVDRGTGLTNLGGGTSLVTTDNDGTSEWYDDSSLYWPANLIPVFGANSFGLGRIVYLTDLNFPTDSVFLRDDNNLFLVNAFQWLSENRAPVVELIFPNGGEIVNNTISITWTAHDPNGDPILGFDLAFSNDSGGSWYPIDAGIMSTSYVWNTSTVSNGASYLIRVDAFDYELVGTDVSDATFTIDNPGPPLPPLPPLPWWWWIVVILVVIIIVVVVLVYLFILRPKSARAK